MKILYLSCHEVLEHDEISLLSELGHEVYSAGAYWNPIESQKGTLRPCPQFSTREEWVELFRQEMARNPAVDYRLGLSRKAVEPFDCIIVMHMPDWIKANWEVTRDKRVIWRTIGQSVASTEQSLAPYRDQGLEIIRYSPREEHIPHYIGGDALIRFYKDPDEYGPWTGEKERVITFAQSMESRGTHCNYHLFENTTRGLPRALYGPGNEQPGLGQGSIPFSQLKEEMRKNGAYFYTGTHPASYTLNFMEAWLSGIPMVCIGDIHGNAEVWRNHKLYEIPSLVTDGVNGFVSDDPVILRKRVLQLLKDRKLAERISRAGRKEAIKHFGKETIKPLWELFLG